MDTSNMSQDELNAHNKLVKETVKLARQEAQYRKEVSESIGDYLNGVEKANTLKKQYLENLKKQKKYEEELKNGSDEEKAAALAKLDIILKTNDALKIQYQALNKALDSVNKKQMIASKLGAEALKSTAKIVTNMPSLIQQGFGKIKGLGLFDMDKSIRTSALSMGLLGKQSEGFRGNIKAAAWEASKVGVSMEQLAEMQSDYSEALGRTITLSQAGAESMAKMATDTQLGVEGAARLSAEFDSQGLSAEKTAQFMNDSMNSSHKMGLNAQKVIKNIAGNIKLLNRYNFKDGIAGLNKMAQTVAKLGVDMEFAAGFADKLWDVEGAVDMAAQLQVMGGEWSKLADPFQLMYKARNDIQGLTEDLGRAAAASAHLNKKGEIEISAMEMHKLKIVAQQTGIAYDELAQAGKNAFKLSKIKTQVQFNMSDEEKEFLANTAQLDKDGKAYIEVDGDKKFLGAMGSAGRDFVKAQMASKEALGERAKQAQTFDDALSNTIMGMKQYLLPIVESINKNLLPKLGAFAERFEKEKWGDKITALANTVGDLISGIGGFILDNPIKSAIGFFLLDKSMWIANGFLLAQGFNAGTKLGELAGATTPSGASGLAPAAKGMSRMKGIGIGAIAGLGGTALDMANESEAFGKKGSTGHKAAGMGASALEWGGTGAMIGSLIAPGIGTAIGAAVGGLGGLIKGGYDEGVFGEKTHDGMFSAYKKGLGSDFNKGRGIIQGGKIHPIDNKDDLMAFKPGGPVDNQLNTNQNVVNKVEFSNITIDGEIRVVSPGNPGLVIDLMKDQGFRRDITRTIQVELEKNKVGGKNKG